MTTSKIPNTPKVPSAPSSLSGWVIGIVAVLILMGVCENYTSSPDTPRLSSTAPTGCIDFFNYAAAANGLSPTELLPHTRAFLDRVSGTALGDEATALYSSLLAGDPDTAAVYVRQMRLACT